MEELLIPEAPAWISRLTNIAEINREFLIGLECFRQSETSSADRKPAPLQVLPENIPLELQECPQWLCWKYDWNGKKWTKPPYNPKGFKVSKTNPQHYSSFAKVLEAYRKGDFDGIGFVLTAADPFVAIDIDHCLEGGVLSAEAQSIIKRMDSYTEISPSGNGIRIFVKGSIPRNIHTAIEMYDHDSYVTVTGQRWLS